MQDINSPFTIILLCFWLLLHCTANFVFHLLQAVLLIDTSGSNIVSYCLLSFYILWRQYLFLLILLLVISLTASLLSSSSLSRIYGFKFRMWYRLLLLPYPYNYLRQYNCCNYSLDWSYSTVSGLVHSHQAVSTRSMSSCGQQLHTNDSFTRSTTSHDWRHIVACVSLSLCLQMSINRKCDPINTNQVI